MPEHAITHSDRGPGRTSKKKAARLRCTAIAVVVGGLALAVPQPGPAERAPSGLGDDPRAVVEKTANDVLAVLQDKTLSNGDKRARVEEIVYQEVDFETLSRLVLGRNWSSLTPAQRDEFMREFKRHLSVTYGSNIDNYKNERMVITGERTEPRGDRTVNSKIIRGGPADVVVDYRLRQRSGQWRIIDVVVEGVSLVANFRSQFQDIIANGGVDRVLQLLREKNEKGEPLQPKEVKS